MGGRGNSGNRNGVANENNSYSSRMNTLLENGNWTLRYGKKNTRNADLELKGEDGKVYFVVGKSSYGGNKGWLASYINEEGRRVHIKDEVHNVLQVYTTRDYAIEGLKKKFRR